MYNIVILASLPMFPAVGRNVPP